MFSASGAARNRPSRAALLLASTVTAACLVTPYRAIALSPLVQLTNCNDSGAGSLRQALLDVADGGTIDAHTSLVGVCNKIVVQSAQLSFGGDNLTIVGPGQDQLSITTLHQAGSIILRYPNRIFSHTGRGTLTLQNLSVSGGLVNASTSDSGACIQSSANVKLIGATVSGCSVISTIGASGGAVQAVGNVYLSNSRVVDNLASGTNDGAFGGGIHAGGVTLRQSTVAGNEAYGNTGATSVVAGGGIDAATVDIAASTISGNTAVGGKLSHYNVPTSTGGGIYSNAGTVSISDSTVSGNTAGYYAGAKINATTATITDSTIAFNQSGRSAGVQLRASTTLALDNDIFSNNVATLLSMANDLIVTGTVAPSGTHNLVFATTSPLPSGTLTNTCPLLAPLADNGGPTQTHALYSHSPAINAGDNVQNVTTDQRGTGYPRIVGGVADIGSYEVNPNDDIFGSGFDGC